MKVAKARWESIHNIHNSQKFIYLPYKEFTHMYENLLKYEIQFLMNTFGFIFHFLFFNYNNLFE